MKILILLLIIPNIAMSLTSYEKEELERRLDLYGLVENKKLIPLSEKIEYDDSIINTLQSKIKKEYIPKLYSNLGHCESGNCLGSNNDYQYLITQKGKVCLPYTQCGFYKCMEEKYQCKQEGVDYFTDLAFPTCSTYTKNIKKKWFTQDGFEWIYSVMVCLQTGLIDECEINDNCDKETRKNTCDYITDFTLKFHPGCYLNSGIGVCKLPLRDKINIWRTVGKYLTDRERQEAYQVVLKCIKLGF